MWHWFLVCAGLGFNLWIWYFFCVNDWKRSSEQHPVYRRYLTSAPLALFALLSAILIPLKAFEHFEAPWPLILGLGLLLLMCLYYRKMFAWTCERAICRREAELKQLWHSGHQDYSSHNESDLRREAELDILAIAKLNNVFDDHEEASEEQLKQEAAK